MQELNMGRSLCYQLISMVLCWRWASLGLADFPVCQSARGRSDYGGHTMFAVFVTHFCLAPSCPVVTV